MKPNYRRCVACRKVALKTDFWRIVRMYPSQEIGLDTGMGRSAYLCPTIECLKAAQKKNRLGKAIKAVVSHSVYEDLEQRLLHPGLNEIKPRILTEDR
jgi:predicted RNA-binding protein YlxR (DUF448 family)